MSSQPLSNQEIADFEQLSEWLREHHPFVFGPPLMAMLKEKLPGNPEAPRQYLDWYIDRSRARRHKEHAPASRQQFIDTVENLNFRRDQMPLIRLLESRFPPFLPLGTAYGKGYTLEPNGDLLEPNREPDGSRIMPFLDNILGINYNVEVRLAPEMEQDRGGERRRRNKTMSEKSTTSGESDDNDQGFVFHQLGTLAVYNGDWSKIKDSAAAERVPISMWNDTGFIVVVECGSGLAGAIYILFNFTPPVQDDGGDVTRDRIESDEAWGYLPGFPPQFSVAKIADRFGDLQFGQKFAFDVKCRHECEIVNAISSGSNAIIRQTVESRRDGESAGGESML